MNILSYDTSLSKALTGLELDHFPFHDTNFEEISMDIRHTL